jgi:hypothetical protein
MRELLKSRLTITLALLAAASLISYVVGHGGGRERGVDGALVIGIACLKIRYVALDFMELRAAPLPLRGAAELLPAVLAVVLILLFLSARQSSNS